MNGCVGMLIEIDENEEERYGGAQKEEEEEECFLWVDGLRIACEVGVES